MGMPFLHPERIQSDHCHHVNWQDQADAEQVAISVSAECLGRLLHNRHLHVEDLTCLDATSKHRVHQLLLALPLRIRARMR